MLWGGFRGRVTTFLFQATACCHLGRSLSNSLGRRLRSHSILFEFAISAAPQQMNGQLNTLDRHVAEQALGADTHKNTRQAETRIVTRMNHAGTSTV